MEFRAMRRKSQLLTQELAITILERGSAGVLGLSGDHGYPYTVPLSYAYRENKLYFHCAPLGHKIDAISKNNKVSFTVIDRDDLAPELFTTFYQSVIIFGKAKILTEETEIRKALELLVEKYCPAHIAAGQQEIDQSIARTSVIEVEIEQISGKTAKEIIQSK